MSGAPRDCDGCTMCCKLLDVVALAKPAGAWCPHCAPGRGCGVYAARPHECRGFKCGFLIDPALGEEWRPSNSRLMLVAEPNRLAAHVDPARPDAWRREPYYGWLKARARAAARTRGQVVAYIGRRAIVMLPDREVDLGPIADDEMIATRETPTPAGMRLDAFKLRRDPGLRDAQDPGVASVP